MLQSAISDHADKGYMSKKEERKNNECLTKKNKRAFFAHLVKYYIVAVCICTLAVIIPLILVWKQAAITSVSLNTSSLQDSITILNKEVAKLSIKIEQLSAPDRIESIAKEEIGLNYPQSKEIIVMDSEERGIKITFLSQSRFWTILKKSFNAGKG